MPLRCVKSLSVNQSALKYTIPVHAHYTSHKHQVTQLTLGQIMSPYGPSPLPNGSFFSCSKLNMIMGRVKTKVLPEPVNAIPIMSRPIRLKERGEMKRHIYVFVLFPFISGGVNTHY